MFASLAKASLACFVFAQVAGRIPLLRPVFNKLGPIIFMSALFLAMVVHTAFCYLTLAPFKVWPEPTQTKVAQLCRMAKKILWSYGFLWAPWITVEVDNANLMSEICREDNARPTLLLGNHTSFMDSVIFIVYGSLHIARLHVVIFKASLLKLPFLGTIVNSEGHLPVFREAEGTCSVAQDQKDILNSKMQSVLSSRQLLCVYPEGTVNKGDCSKLAPFRYGTFKLAIQNDAEIVGWVTSGNDKSWPGTAALGGRPANIRATAVKFAPQGALAYLKQHGIRMERKDGESQEELLLVQSSAMAEAIQKQMQAELDRLYAAGGTKKDS